MPKLNFTCIECGTHHQSIKYDTCFKCRGMDIKEHIEREYNSNLPNCWEDENYLPTMNKVMRKIHSDYINNLLHKIEINKEFQKPGQEY